MAYPKMRIIQYRSDLIDDKRRLRSNSKFVTKSGEYGWPFNRQSTAVTFQLRYLLVKGGKLILVNGGKVQLCVQNQCS